MSCISWFCSIALFNLVYLKNVQNIYCNKNVLKSYYEVRKRDNMYTIETFFMCINIVFKSIVIINSLLTGLKDYYSKPLALNKKWLKIFFV